MATADRRAVDERRREEIAEFGPVDGIDRNAERARVVGDAAVERLIAAGGEHQHRAVEMRGIVGGVDMARAVGGDPARASSGSALRATMRSTALDWPSSRALASASSPPPTMTTASPSTRMKTGKALSLAGSCGMASEIRNSLAVLRARRENQKERTRAAASREAIAFLQAATARRKIFPRVRSGGFQLLLPAWSALL